MTCGQSREECVIIHDGKKKKGFYGRGNSDLEKKRTLNEPKQKKKKKKKKKKGRVKKKKGGGDVSSLNLGVESVLTLSKGLLLSQLGGKKGVRFIPVKKSNALIRRKGRGDLAYLIAKI